MKNICYAVLVVALLGGGCARESSPAPKDTLPEQLSTVVSVVERLGELPYQSDDEAGLTPRAMALARMIASTDYCQSIMRIHPARFSHDSVLMLGFESGPEMGTDAPSPCYRFRLYRSTPNEEQTQDWLIFDPESCLLYVEDMEDGRRRPIQVDPALLQDFKYRLGS